MPSRPVQLSAAAAVALGVVARFANASHLRLDEAMSVNIAGLPLARMAEALRHDGAPPAYYLLLAGWMRVFGAGDVAVRALSGVLAVAALPLVWMVGRRLGGSRVAWASLLLLASSPFAARYATEARMYSLVIVLVLGGLLALDHLLRARSRRAFVALAAVTGLLLLTHYWSLFLLAVAAAVLAVRAVRGSEAEARRGARRALAAIGTGSLLFGPWLPSFLYQARHTGTPWGRPGGARAVVDTVFYFAGGYRAPGLGVALGLLSLVLMAVALRRPRVGGRATLARALAVVAFGTLVLAVAVSQVTGSAFAARYAAVVFPLAMLLAGLGVASLSDRRMAGGVLVGATVLGLAACVPNIVSERTSAGRVAEVLTAEGRPGDVVAYCPDQLGPSVARLLPSGRFTQLTFPRATGPELVDWVGYEDANRAAPVGPFARMLLDRAGPTHDLWVVWAPGYRTLGTKCEQLLDELRASRPAASQFVDAPSGYFERPELVRYPPAPRGRGRLEMADRTEVRVRTHSDLTDVDAPPCPLAGRPRGQ